MAQEDFEEPVGSPATHSHDLTSRMNRSGIPVGLITALSAIMGLGMLACTSSDVPTQPEPTATFASAAAASHFLTPVDLGLPDPYSIATALNNRGQVVGERASAFEAPGRAFLWAHGEVTDLGTLGGLFARAFGINERGQVVGDATIAGGQTHAFLWEHGTMRDLGTLGSDWSSAQAVNNQGQVIGNSMTSLNDVHGFLWEHGVMTDLGTLGGVATYPFALNNKGQVVGSSLTTIEPSPGQPVATRSFGATGQ
jgi:probable HAF family extracellular repeat protein